MSGSEKELIKILVKYGNGYIFCFVIQVHLINYKHAQKQIWSTYTYTHRENFKLINSIQRNNDQNNKM